MAAVIGLRDGHLLRNIYQKVCRRHVYCVQRALRSTVASVQTVETAEYPPIKPRYPPGQWADMEEWKCWYFHQKALDIQTLPKVKERLEKLSGTVNRRNTLLTPLCQSTLPGDIEYKQYLTKTHIADGLPDVYSTMNVDNELQLVKPFVLDAILQHECDQHKRTADNSRANKAHSLMGQVLGVLLATLSHSNDHLRRSQFDENVRVESWWKKLVEPDKDAFEKLDEDSFWRQKRRNWWEFMNVQSKHTASYQIRTEMPLPQFLPIDDTICTEGAYPKVDFTPRTFGVRTFRGRPVTVSGHWIADPCEFGQLAVHVLSDRFDGYAAQYGDASVDELFCSYALLTSFGWCLAQAHNQGFNVFLDVTYPLTTQTLVTDGRRLQLSAFQLNTARLWQSDGANRRRNVLWAGAAPLALYDDVDGGQVRGFSDDALRLLLRALLLAPAERRGVDLRCYLPDEPAPVQRRRYFNHRGEPPYEIQPIGRFQYPAKAIYF